MQCDSGACTGLISRTSIVHDVKLERNPALAQCDAEQLAREAGEERGERLDLHAQTPSELPAGV
ncbi:hypothetical protein HJFPF1_13097 [Paramyrothecium foliicola]|nr:hypothetical protein HJFPF1_13097 [Paramyrothecium foliicola]